MRKALLIILAIWLIATFVPAMVSAYDDPDTVDVINARVFRHMLEANDTLMMARFDISYGNASYQPQHGINTTFDFTYTTTGSVVAGNVTAYPMTNMGYLQGLVGFYWAANDTDIPAWGDLGNITATGDAAYFGAPLPTDTYTLISSDYVSVSSPADIREDLRHWLIAQLTFVELDWNNWFADIGYENRQIDLLAVIPPEYTVLHTSGEAYMSNTVDDFRDMCPNIYWLQITQPTHDEGNWTLTQQSRYEQLHTTDYVGNATTAVGNLMGGVDQIWAASILTLFASLGVVIVCQHYWQKANIGMLIAYVIILLATPEGLIQMGLMALFPFIAVLLIAHTFFWSRSAG